MRAVVHFVGLSLLTVSALCVVACGGGNGNPAAPATPTPTPTRPPVTGLVYQNTYSGLLDGDTITQHFHTNYRGSISVVVDWTFPRTRAFVGFVVVAGKDTCYLTARPNNACQYLAISSINKPSKASTADVPAGDFTLYITNFSLDTESISYQIFLTSPDIPSEWAAGALPPITAQEPFVAADQRRLAISEP